MKNKKQIFSLVLMLLLYIGNQSMLFGKEGELKSTKKNIDTLKSNATKLKTQPNLSPEKRETIEDILERIKNLEDNLSELDDKKIETESGEARLIEINKKLFVLSGEISKQGNSNPPPISSTPNTKSDENAQNQNNPKTTTSQIDNKNNAGEDWLDSLLKWGLIGLGSLIVLGGISAGAYFLRRNKQQEREEITANFNQLRKQQRTFDGEIKQLAEVSKNLSQQIAQQKSEISGLKQMSQNASYAAPSPPIISAYQQPVEIPQFPVTVDDYLAKVKNGAIPVKYDYKEKMLVEDGEKEGNLLVVQDASTAGNLLYLVPSFGFFQKKSDYTSYFENYYLCSHPTSGSVWIRQPATVHRVNGGWQLAQQGELEVR